MEVAASEGRCGYYRVSYTGVDTFMYIGVDTRVGVDTSVVTGVTVDDTSGVDPVWTITCDW